MQGHATRNIDRSLVDLQRRITYPLCMQRKGSLALAIALLLTLAAPVQAATPKAGAKCNKAGTTATASGKKFTCIKSGTKLVWNKGVAVATRPTPTPTPSGTPTPSPSPSPSITPSNTPTPTPSPVVEKAPTGFSDLAENFKGVYLGVWNTSNSKITTNPPLDVKQNILLAPNTKLPNIEIPEMYNRGTQFFAGYIQPKRFNALYYVQDDIKWAEAKVLELYGNPDEVQQISRNCQSAQRCNGANAGVPQIDLGHANYAVTNGASDPYHLKGGIEIHEYTHMVQFMQFQGKPTQRMNGGLGLLPNWFIEGHAHLAGNAASAKTLAQYKEFRSFWLNARAEGLPGYSPESIESFYEKLAPGKFDSSVQSNVYSIGYFSVEALASIKGVDSPIEVIKLVSDGSTWDEAFLKVYGITWKEAAPIVAKTVSRMFLER
jgi:hypothetical protein